MSTRVTPSPPRGQVASPGRVTGRQAAPRAGRRWFRLPRASTTPGKLWLARAALVLLCLAWGALATLMVSQHASAAAAHVATAWFAVNQHVQQLDRALDYGAETQLVIGSGPGTAGTLFGQLESNLGTAINADQAVFASNAAAGADAFTGLEAGIIVLTLLMAVGCAWGLTVRLAEYR